MQNSELSGSFASDRNLLRSSKVRPAHFPACAPARFSIRQAAGQPPPCVARTQFTRASSPRQCSRGRPPSLPPPPPRSREPRCSSKSKHLHGDGTSLSDPHPLAAPPLWKPLDVGEVLWCNFRGAGTPMTPPLPTCRVFNQVI